MPAVVNKTVGSFSGTRGAEGMILCPLLSKNFRYLSRISLAFIMSVILTLVMVGAEESGRKCGGKSGGVWGEDPAEKGGGA